MVKPAVCRIGLICSLVFAGIASAQAGYFAAWKVGEPAPESVATPVALNVVNAQATAKRKAELARKVPAIYLSHSSITNDMVHKVRESFEAAHSHFLASLEISYHKTVLDDAAIQSPDFDYFVTAFNIQNKRLLITTAIAQEWARGGSGLDTLTNLTQLLLKTTSRPVRPDEVPDGFPLGDSVRLVPVHSSSDKVTLQDAQKRGKVVSLNSVTTVTRLRGLFRRNFSQEDQLFARQLATYIHPNCFPDPALSAVARARETAKVTFVNHYAAGQVIVRRGEVVDDQIRAALVKLSQAVPPEQLPAQVASVSAHAPATAMSRPHHPPQKLPKKQAGSQTVATHAGSRQIWLTASAAAAGSLFLVLGVVMVVRRRKTSATSRAAGPLQYATALPVELAPQITQALKSAVAQELAAQRQELLKTQQTAATEVLRLMQRLNELHAPWQERLAAYEKRIQELERELSLRTEENRELLTLKIELLRQQLEAERGNPRANFTN